MTTSAQPIPPQPVCTTLATGGTAHSCRCGPGLLPPHTAADPLTLADPTRDGEAVDPAHPRHLAVCGYCRAALAGCERRRHPCRSATEVFAPWLSWLTRRAVASVIVPISTTREDLEQAAYVKALVLVRTAAQFDPPRTLTEGGLSPFMLTSLVRFLWHVTRVERDRTDPPVDPLETGEDADFVPSVVALATDDLSNDESLYRAIVREAAAIRAELAADPSVATDLAIFDMWWHDLLFGQGNKPITQRDIADRLGVTQTMVSRRVLGPLKKRLLDAC